ncbi:hypothetical protein IHE55_20375 [Streptomyces pactum]|uniref:Uncharacterized protein n=1 Tax=Streptomyces pactum TaxID=68249 RepID=A0ABS0NP94_9ACTN|nr:hypothetical protein [Streptomyces pactum]MBH5336991.1 hypothetical protein [Streptomyces pactum]
MTLARSLPDDATEWWIFLGVLALYVLGRWFFAWLQARRDGDDHPVRAALAEEEGPDDTRAAATGGFRSYRQFAGFVVSGVVVALVATLTDGGLRVVLLWIVVPLLTLAMSYLDFRQARRARARA